MVYGLVGSTIILAIMVGIVWWGKKKDAPKGQTFQPRGKGQH